jgi:signal transduction histidine kinase/CheY-like chemotaxis protein
MDELPELSDGEARSRRRLTFLLEASTLLASILDYEETLRRLARLSVPTLADMCIIDILEADGTIRRVAAVHANPDKRGLVETLQRSFPPDPHGPHPVAVALRTGVSQVALTITEPVLAAVADDHPAHREIARALEYTSYIIVPMVAHGRTLGALSLVTGESRRRYSADEVVLAEDLARRAALAVDNARLFTESETRRRAAEALAATGGALSQSLGLQDLTQRIITSVRQLIGGTCAVLYRHDPAAKVYMAMAVSGDTGPGFQGAFTVPEGLGTIGLAVRERQAVTTADILADPRVRLDDDLRQRILMGGHRAAAAAPLVVQDEVIGGLLLTDRGHRRFTTDEVRIIGAFADQAAAAFNNARLYAEAERRRLEAESAAAELRRLQTISDVALTSLAVDDLLRELLGRVRTVLGVDSGAVLLIDRDRQVLIHRAVSGLEEGLDQLPIPVGEGFSGRVAQAQGPVVAEDISKIPMYRPLLAARGIRSLLGAPLIVAGRATGVIRVCSTRPRHFDEADARLLQLVADRVALAIEHAHLYEAERSARSEAEAANRTKDQFLAMLAHELRNPLAPIRSGIYVIGRRLAGDPMVERAQRIIERQLQHLTRLLDDLLDVARITQGKIELVRVPLDLGTIVSEAVDAARGLLDGKGHSVGLNLPERPVRLAADPTRLVQIVSNLLSNAAKYTPANGIVTVTAGEERGWATITVEDNGIGIAPELLPRVFDLFSQLDPSTARTEGGLGVGLTLVRRLAELHGGRVTARSRGRGQGSAFVVHLPAGVRTVPPPAGAAQPQATVRRRILVVEDNADAATMLRTALELDGHHVRTAADGPAGVAEALSDKPDIMLVDIGLPGMDGYEVARQARRALGSSVALVALTGYGQPADRRRATEAGFDAHLVKPLDPDKLKDLIARC